MSPDMEKVVIVSDDVTTKFPQEVRPKSIMFETTGLGLTTQDQRQQNLELEQAAEAAKPILNEVGSVTRLNESK